MLGKLAAPLPLPCHRRWALPALENLRRHCHCQQCLGCVAVANRLNVGGGGAFHLFPRFVKFDWTSEVAAAEVKRKSETDRLGGLMFQFVQLQEVVQVPFWQLLPLGHHGSGRQATWRTDMKFSSVLRRFRDPILGVFLVPNIQILFLLRLVSKLFFASILEPTKSLGVPKASFSCSTYCRNHLFAYIGWVVIFELSSGGLWRPWDSFAD